MTLCHAGVAMNIALASSCFSHHKFTLGALTED